MSWEPDYTQAYSDVFVDPEDRTGGIYILDDAGYTPPHRETREIPFSDVRMREPRPRRREGFTGAYRNPRNQFEEYQRWMPSETLLRSRRRGDKYVEESAWDNRPPGFRPDDGPRESAFYPPPNVRPPLGGYITPWETSHKIPYAEAIMRQSQSDPNMIGLAPCPAAPSPAAQPQPKEKFASTLCGGECFTIKNGMTQISVISVLKLILFLIIVILLAILVTATITEKKCMANLKEQIRDALAELKR